MENCTDLAVESYENGGGCFSGSAIDLSDGRQLLVYTGVLSEKQPDGTTVSYTHLTLPTIA